MKHDEALIKSFLLEELDLPVDWQGYDLLQHIEQLIEGVRQDDESSLREFHVLLAALNKQRLSINQIQSVQVEQSINAICTMMESAWLLHERTKIESRMQEVPTTPEEFCTWFENLSTDGYGQNHPLFLYLAERGDFSEFSYFFQQELCTEAGFDDLVAMTQVQTPYRVKMELAHNFWDEMGEGEMEGIHSLKLEQLSKAFGLEAGCEEEILWEPLALSNVMLAFATKRALFSQSIGALGVIELTSPTRCHKLVQGLHRVGMRPEDYHYYALHSSLDQEHWTGWRDNVMMPLLVESQQYCAGMAEGALMRLYAGYRCFEAYARKLGLESSHSEQNEAAVQAA